MTVTNLWKTFLPILCAGCLMTACSKDSDNPFSGIDNHIISFTLEKGDSKWQAAIIDNQIVLTVPEKTELTNAKINYRLSELATINPDPSTITAWDEERQFTVTSYNGTSQVYKYTIQRSATSETGNFTFNSQAEIDAFAQEHQVSVIKGNVYIGTAESKDTITNLNALKEIKEITYSLNIGQYYQGTDLAGLSNLEKLGSLSIQDEINKLALESISLPKLESIGEGFYIDCRKSATKEISMPSLKMALTDCAIECPTIEKLNLNSLETLGGN